MRKVMVAMAAVLLTLGACTSIDCPMNHQVFTTYKMFKANGSPDTLKTDTMWIVTQRSDGSDSLLVNALTGTSATYFNLPISYMQPEDTFHVFLVTAAQKVYLDTFYVKKTNYPHFESVDCQASFFHEITGVRTKGHLIDSIKIINPNANYDRATEHFHIFLRSNR